MNKSVTKRILALMLVLMLVLSITACQQSSTPAQTPSNDAPETTDTPKTDTPSQEPAAGDEPAVTGGGKVAIITNTVSQNEEEYRSAQTMVSKYGEDKVVHVTWPDNFMAEQEQMVSVVAKIAADKDIKALIINQAVPGTNAAVDKLLETRDDMLIVYATPQENPPDVHERADIIVQPDELGMGYKIPAQAKKLGAKVLVHYSFPRHMSQVLLSGRRDIMIEQCKELDLEFVDATAPDPTGDQGTTGAQMFILEDVPKMVDKYGKDTAFFSTNCSMQVPLIKACVDAGAIYPQPCCPSPYHGFPAALGITVPEDMVGNMQNVIDQTSQILEEKGVLGRFSTWPVPVSMMNTIATTEYAFKWMNGETDGKLDVPVLEQCMSDYAGMKVELSNYSEKDEDDNETVYEKYFLEMMDFLTYGE